MVTLLLGRWRLLAGLTAATLALGYIGVLRVEVASLRATVAMLDGDVSRALGRAEQCEADLAASIITRRNRDETDSLSIDDLRDGLPDHWLRFLPPTDAPAR